MNKITKLYLIVPALLFLPMSVAAKATGWYTTPDGKNHMFNAEEARLLTLSNTEKINELTKDIKARNLKGERGKNGKDGGVGATGRMGDPGLKGYQGIRGVKGKRGYTGARGLTGDSFYADNYGNMNLLSVIAVGDAVSNMPAPTSNGFFTSIGFSDLGGEQAGAIGIYYVDDILSYKATYGHGGHERSIGFGIGIRL